MIYLLHIDTPLGEMIAGATEEGICLLEFNGSRRAVKETDDLVKQLKTSAVPGKNRHLTELQNQLKEYFAGTRKEFCLPLVNPGTDFQLRVWKELLKIPFGVTRSYQDQADALGNHSSVRAVANANGMNRIAIIIPCHRVIGANGSLTGYGGGLKRKKWLIDHEKRYSGQPYEKNLFQ